MYVGGIYVHGGGLGTNFGTGQGGVSVWNNGMKVQSSLSVNSGGLVVATNGFTLSSGGLVIGNGGLACTGGLTVQSELRGGLLKGLLVQGGMTSANNGMVITQVGCLFSSFLSYPTKPSPPSSPLPYSPLPPSLHSSTSLSSLLPPPFPPSYLPSQDGIKGIVGGLVVGTAGLSLTDGLTIASGGLYLNKKGLTSIYNSGLWVTRGGISINNHILGAGLKGGMLLTGGMSVYTGGLVVKNPGGLYENNAGIYIEKGGVSIGNGGTYVPAKIDVLEYGCHISEGLSINSDGLLINGGLTIESGGFALTSGMPITGRLPWFTFEMGFFSNLIPYINASTHINFLMSYCTLLIYYPCTPFLSPPFSPPFLSPFFSPFLSSLLLILSCLVTIVPGFLQGGRRF